MYIVTTRPVGGCTISRYLRRHIINHSEYVLVPNYCARNSRQARKTPFLAYPLYISR